MIKIRTHYNLTLISKDKRAEDTLTAFIISNRILTPIFAVFYFSTLMPTQVLTSTFIISYIDKIN